MFLLFALVSYEPEVFHPKYSQTSILHAAHFRRVVNGWIVIELKTVRHAGQVSSQIVILCNYFESTKMTSDKRLALGGYIENENVYKCIPNLKFSGLHLLFGFNMYRFHQ